MKTVIALALGLALLAPARAAAQALTSADTNAFLRAALEVAREEMHLRGNVHFSGTRGYRMGVRDSGQTAALAAALGARVSRADCTGDQPCDFADGRKVVHVSDVTTTADTAFVTVHVDFATGIAWMPLGFREHLYRFIRREGRWSRPELLIITVT